jgi:hypothetical protein
MASLDFFAARDDLRCLLEWMFAETDVRVFDTYSEYERPIGEYRTVADLESVHELGVDKHRGSNYALLGLWSRSACGEPLIRRIDLEPTKCSGARFRFSLDGGGITQLYLGEVHQGKWLTKTHFGYQSLERARAWGTDGGIDWSALYKIGRKIQYHVIRRMAVAKMGALPILPHALGLSDRGITLTDATSCSWSYDPADVVRFPAR